MKPEAKANDWIIHSHTGSRVICRETATFCPPSAGNDPVEGDKITNESNVNSGVCRGIKNGFLGHACMHHSSKLFLGEAGCTDIAGVTPTSTKQTRFPVGISAKVSKLGY